MAIKILKVEHKSKSCDLLMRNRTDCQPIQPISIPVAAILLVSTKGRALIGAVLSLGQSRSLNFTYLPTMSKYMGGVNGSKKHFHLLKKMFQ